MILFKRNKVFASSIEADVVAKMPLTLFEGKITVIDDFGPEYNRAIKFLKRHKVIGFDTETRPVFTPHAPQNGVALLQLSTAHHAFLFRIHKIGLEDPLASILASEKILKIGAAVHDDIRGLQKIFPFAPSSFVDLQKMCEDYGIRDKSLKKLTAIVLGRRISKTQQLSNWEAPALSDAQQIYAATDAWICRKIYFEFLRTVKKPASPASPSSPASVDGQTPDTSGPAQG